MQSKRRVCDKSNKGAVELHKGYRKYVTPDKTIKESVMATTHQVVIRRVMFFECFERSKAENTHLWEMQSVVRHWLRKQNRFQRTGFNS